MAHMSTSCVGCGQCSSACPMGIRVAEIFRAVARRTQASFNYVAGRSLEEPLPLATFREEELEPR
jgi:formate dehydrogenase subunit beta